MTDLVIFDPAAAIAAGRCLAARVRDRDRWLTTDHPSRCGWCDYPTDVLDGLVRGFNAWAGYSERTGTFAHHEMRVWAESPAEEQLVAIVAAQELVDEPPPAPKAVQSRPAAPADEAPVGGSGSSGDAAAVGPHGSRVSGETGSEVSAPSSPADPPRPDWLGGPS